jgi:hypothetical protein
MSLWKEFTTFIKEQAAIDVTEEEIAKEYLKDLDAWENLGDHIHDLAEFIAEKFRERFGDVNGLWFLTDPDYEAYKYNQIRVTKAFQIGGKKFDIEVNALDLRWGIVADSPEDFNKTILKFIEETKEKLDLLHKKLPAKRDPIILRVKKWLSQKIS